MKIEIIEQRLVDLITKAKRKNEVPVGAVIVKDNKIISSAYNKVNKKNNILNHAEIIAIKKASKKLKNWRLDGCTLYVTLEPCLMCREIIRKSRIDKVYFFVKQNGYDTENLPKYEKLEDNRLFFAELQQFFKKRR